jgi:hypothetical protein
MLKAQLIDLGRNKVNKTIEVKDTKALHKEVGKHILSKGWGMDETNEHNVYAVTSGWNTVGTVKILEE